MWFKIIICTINTIEVMNKYYIKKITTFDIKLTDIKSRK